MSGEGTGIITAEGARRFVSKVIEGNAKSVYGLKLNKANQDFVVVVNSRKWGTVVAPMPDQISFSVTSEWASLIPAINQGVYGKALDVLFQTVSNGRFSFSLKGTSRRIWKNTSPVGISLRLSFSAENDSLNEVVNPIRLLQSMALPTADKYIGVLSPPGPSPFLIRGGGIVEFISGTGGEEYFFGGGGDFIMVSIGSFLVFPLVILSNVESKFSSVLDEKGYPLNGEANVVFQTYEIVTGDDLKDFFLSY